MNKKKQEKIKAFCEKYHMFDRGDGIVIGLSGGADSVFLLHFLKEIQEEYELRLYAVHVHHGIRGTEADQDEAYAGRCAEGLGIPFESVHYNMPLLAKQNGMSEEETGRHYRYQCFREIAKRQNCNRIAVAHHKDDQAETVLFQLLRGSGLRGLGGIRPRQGDIIRPLLAISRQEIEEELQIEGIGWQEDTTNQRKAYARNKLRLDVIPYLQREIQKETVEHLAETALQLQTAWEYLYRQARQAAEGMICQKEGKIQWKRSVFLELDTALQPYVLLEFMEELAGSRKDLGSVHVSACIDLIQGRTGRRISLPYGLQMGRDYDVIWMGKAEKPESGRLEEIAENDGTFMEENSVQGETGKVPGETQGETGQSGGDSVTAGKEALPGEVRMKKIPRIKLSEGIPKNHCTKWFDYAKIMVGFVWRHPMPGDYLVIDRQGHAKKLSRIFIESKIPKEKRNTLWVLADGKHILWVPQIGRTSMGYYVTEETTEVLTVQIEGERWSTL